MDPSLIQDYSKLPLSPPPPGVTPNFTNPDSRAPAVYITAGICMPLIVIFAGLRFYAKLTFMKGKALNDLTCLLGVIGGITAIGITLACVAGGAYGLHQWDITIGEFSKHQLILTLVSEISYGPFIWFIKLSLFVLYLELFGRLRWMRYLATVGMIVTGLFYFSTMIAFAVMCTPRGGHSQMAYLQGLASQQCLNTRPVIVLTGAVNVVSDLYLIVLPLPAVWSLNMPFQRKLGIAAIFLTGFVACIASILGLAFRIDGNKSLDNTWHVIPTWDTTIVEMTAGILVCCMPTLAAVFRHWKPPITSFLTSSRRRLRSSSRFEKRHAKLSSDSDLRLVHAHEKPATNSKANTRGSKDGSISGHTLAGSENRDTEVVNIPAKDNSTPKPSKLDKWKTSYLEMQTQASGRSEFAPEVYDGRN